MTAVQLRAELIDLVDDDYISATEIDRLILRATRKLERDFVRDASWTPRQMLLTYTGVTTPNGLMLPSDFQRARTVIMNSHPMRYASPEKIAPGSSPDDTQVTLYYYSRLADLTDTVSNWVYDSAPDLYLYAAALQWAPRQRDDARLGVWGGLYDDAFQSVCEANCRLPKGSWLKWKGRPYKGLYTISGDYMRFGGDSYPGGSDECDTCVSTEVGDCVLLE